MRKLLPKMWRLAAAALMTCFSLTATAQDASLSVSASSPTVSESFNSMWDGSEATLALPDGWRVDRNLTAPRTVGAWASASGEVMYSGGVSLASNAKNGTWNFGSSSDPSDRAIGGLSTTVSGGTRCVSLMTRIDNTEAATAIEALTLSYDIEKYRDGSNSAGFDVQLYYSTDGNTWTNAGEGFRTHFEPDASTIGAETVPISVTAVSNKALRLRVEAGASVYLAWNITVATGSSPNLAPGLSLDNISVTAAFEGENNDCLIYAEDVTKWSNLLLKVDGGEALSATGSASVNGVNYKYFTIPADGTSHSLAFTNGGSRSVDGGTVTAEGEVYLCVTADEVTVISDPENYTGWVDPDRKPFVASGIYLRGEINSWGASSDWEFSDEGDNTYVLYDKTLNGSFKVADASWSSACNYGSNGSSISMDTPYALVLGTNDNISSGGNTFACKRIILTIGNEGATLLLESNNDDTDLTEVFIIGDFNGWDYMDRSGVLTAGDNPDIFSGQVTLSAASGETLSMWRLYQRLGMGGVWGNAGGEDATEATVSGTLEKGSTGKLAAEPGTYLITFNILTGEYSLEQLGSVPTDMTFRPENVVLVPTLPDEVKVLSLNNSLIYYHDQDQVFNAIASAAGKNATWKKHTLLGKSLNAHWNEGDGLAGDGLPGAKMLIRKEAWSHIILQEQSSLPRTDPEQFRSNVKKWVEYIRDYCPNPNAIIIMPVNWAYSGDWENFTAFNSTFVKNYLDVAREFGITLCPVGVAYQHGYDALGGDGIMPWFEDDRHPTLPATYMAACMEYQTIFGEDASTITYVPDGLSAADAAQMRDFASGAFRDFDVVVNHPAATVQYKVTVTDQFGMELTPESAPVFTANGGNISADGLYTADGTLGTYTLEAICGDFNREAQVTVAEAVTEVPVLPSVNMNTTTLSISEDFNTLGTAAGGNMPEGWRIDRQTDATRLVGRFDQADDAPMYAGGTSLASNAKNGTWNFGATDDENDRAPGGITTGVANGSRAINVYAHLLNDGSKNIENLALSYDVEKYRDGNNTAGFAVQLYYSLDGRNWTSAGNDFYTFFEADNATAGYANAPGKTVNVEGTLPVKLERSCDLFLAWNISVASGDAAQGAMALGIDNVSLSGELPVIPEAKHYVYVDDKTEWDAIGLYAWGDGELFGAWPGEAVAGDVEIGETVYKVFLLDTEGGNYHLIFNNWNNGEQYPDYDIVADRDYYFLLEGGVVKEVTPVIPLKGDVNNDGTVNAGDVAAVYNVLLGVDTENAARADVNGDGTVNAGDTSAVYDIIINE